MEMPSESSVPPVETDDLLNRSAGQTASTGPMREHHHAGRWPRLSYVLSHLRRSRRSVAALWLLAAFVLVALTADIIAPHHPDHIVSPTLIHGPIWAASGSFSHLLGTDDIGRDLLSRLIHGAQFTLIVSFVATLLAGGIGTALGMIAGFYGGIISTVICRITDAFIALPYFLIALVVAAGSGLSGAIIAVGVVASAPYTRLVRAQTWGSQNAEHVTAAASYGAGPRKLMVEEVLPSCFGVIIVQAPLTFSHMLLTCAALGFLGLGAAAPAAEWGTMLGDSRQLWLSHPWLMIAPAVCLMAVVLAVNVLSDAVRDALADLRRLR